MQSEPISEIEAPGQRVYISEYTYEEVFASLPAYERVWRALVVSVKWGAIGFAYSLACAALMDGEVFVPSRQGMMHPLREVLIFIVGMMPVSWAWGYAHPYMTNWWRSYLIGIVISIPLAAYSMLWDRMSLRDLPFIMMMLLLFGGPIGWLGKGVMRGFMQGVPISCPRRH